ncbi:hypothetical protein JKF63_01636 [Porcisia hertigi]|uniref:Uncharacterized protein n=1 Tax=Porcisia hertigi TaxID=2761500 RepID=A0A836L0J9_9TRYP|nr:hypothetical protein JKF63_01636 [Porcisia hertigi]
MRMKSVLSAVSVLLVAYLLFLFTHDHGILSTRHSQEYCYVTNDTQKLLDEARREAARVAAAMVGSSEQTTASTLKKYGVALKDGDENLASTIEYVHQYEQLRDGHSARARSAAASHPPVRAHVFLAADNGTYSGMHELFYIRAAMRYSTPIHIEGCRSAHFGFLEKPVRDPPMWGMRSQRHAENEVVTGGLRKIPVLAVTTGIFVTSAATCTAAVMELPMFRVQSVTLIGTAGVSPVVGGGGWNPRVPPKTRVGESVEVSEKAANPVCQQHWAPEAEKVALGSVCVTHASLIQECGLCVEENDLSSLCSRPRCRMQNSTSLFGPCSFRHPVSSFAEQMKRAMNGKPFPSPSDTVRKSMQAFWEANEAAAEDANMHGSKRTQGSTFSRDASASASSAAALLSNRQPPTTPILLTCAEVSTSQILAGPRSDVLCRQYTEELFQGLYAAKDLSCVQAMEGAGVLHVLTQEFPTVPVAIVRGASNYDMFPLSRHVYRLNNTAVGARQAVDDWYVAWDQKEHFISDDEFHRYMKASFQYSIETASAVVLNYFLSAETALPGP